MSSFSKDLMAPSCVSLGILISMRLPCSEFHGVCPFWRQQNCGPYYKSTLDLITPKLYQLIMFFGCSNLYYSFATKLWFVKIWLPVLWLWFYKIKFRGITNASIFNCVQLRGRSIRYLTGVKNSQKDRLVSRFIDWILLFFKALVL